MDAFLFADMAYLKNNFTRIEKKSLVKMKADEDINQQVPSA